MAGFLEIVAIAFVTQLLVLPGEKVQFIIAGLATRYRPLLVVSAAGAAFAGWTAVEIAFGAAIQGLLPGAVLDVLTALLFLAFAILLVRSAPDPGEVVAGDADDSGVETDGGERMLSGDAVMVAGHEIPLAGRFGIFLPIFAMMAAGEFGDKTQVVTIGLAFQYGATPAIWVGEMLAIIPISLVNAYLFHRLSHAIDMRKAHFAGAAIFLFFGLDTLLAVATGFSVWETIVATLSEILLSVV